jgi:hypothetical protein
MARAWGPAPDRTGVVAKLIELFGRLEAQPFLDTGKSGALRRVHPWARERVGYAGLRVRLFERQGTIDA